MNTEPENKQPLYPLLFNNNFRTVLWGGHNLKPMKGLPADDQCVGESWEVSTLPGSESVVKNGFLAGFTLDALTAKYGALLLGGAVAEKYGDKFPLLVKYIDAAQNLSVQVHPGDELAQARHGSFGKSEMWYVVKAAPDAYLYSGFCRHITKEEYDKRIQEGSICEVLQRHEVKAGDVFYIPAGRIHAICSGIMVAEIQQSCDITYRIYDYYRHESDGTQRQLHVAEARDAIDYTFYDNLRTYYKRKTNKPVALVESPYFVVKLLEVNRSFHRKLFKYDSFVICMCVEGDCNIRINSTAGYGSGVMPEVCSIYLSEGNSCLIPASVADYYVEPMNQSGTTKLLETYIDNNR